MARDPGSEFELEVARLYEALGYAVRRDELIAGQQVDIIAERFVAGIGLTRLIVECKYLANGSVSNQAVHDFLSTFGAIGHANGFTAGVLVTNRDFSRYAREATARAGAVHLRRSGDLAKEVFSAIDAAHQFVRDHEASSLYRQYVPLRALGDVRGQHPRLEIRNSQDRIFDPMSIEDALLGWICQRQPALVTIFADFGAGKTSLLQRIKYRLSKAMVDSGGDGALTPIFFALRDIARYENLDSYITATLVREFRHPIPLHVFWRLLREGVLVPLLDGFDEALMQSDAVARRTVFEHLTPLIVQSSGVAVLTSRESLFASDNEYMSYLQDLSDPPRPVHPERAAAEHGERATANADMRRLRRNLQRQFLDEPQASVQQRFLSIVRLKTFDSNQIEAYLARSDALFQRVTGKDWRQVLSALKRIYDLSDLMRRPVLLEMITQTVSQGALDLDGNNGATLGAASLYEVYTHIQLATEQRHKNRALFSASERQAFAQLVALRMYEQGRHDADLREASEGARDYGPALTAMAERVVSATAAEVMTDIRLCTFLTLNDDGRFQFTHKSFMEFFLARHIRQSLLDGKREPLLSTPLPGEVAFFLGSFAGVDQDLHDALLLLMQSCGERQDSEARDTRANLFASLCHEVVELTDATLSHCCVRNMTFGKLRWARLGLHHIDLFSVCIAELRMTNCEMDSCEISHSTVSSLDVIHSSIELSLQSSEVAEIRLENRSDVALAGMGVSVNTLSVNDSAVVLRCGGRIERCIVRGGSLTLDEVPGGFHTAEVDAERSVLVIRTARLTVPMTHISLQARDSVLLGIPARQCLRMDVLLKDKRLELIDTLVGCHGLALIGPDEPAVEAAVGVVAQVAGFVLINVSSTRQSDQARREAILALGVLAPEYRALAQAVLADAWPTAANK